MFEKQNVLEDTSGDQGLGEVWVERQLVDTPAQSRQTLLAVQSTQALQRTDGLRYRLSTRRLGQAQHELPDVLVLCVHLRKDHS